MKPFGVFRLHHQIKSKFAIDSIKLLSIRTQWYGTLILDSIVPRKSDQSIQLLFKYYSTTKTTNYSSFSISKLSRLLQGTVVLPESFFYALCKKREELSLSDLAKSIRIASDLSFDKHVELLAEVKCNTDLLLKFNQSVVLPL